MKTILIIIALVAIWFLVPRLLKLITPWLTRRALRYAGKKAGIDPDLLKQAFGENQEKKKSRFTSDSSGNAGRQRSRRRTSSSGPIIPKEYAVDVEFTEIHSYSEETVIHPDPAGGKQGKGFFRKSTRIEEQVSDAEIIEIIPDRK